MVDPQNPFILYAGFNNGYDSFFSVLYKSTDGGISWRSSYYDQSRGLDTYVLKIDPRNPNIIYAATSNGIYKSADGAQSWALHGHPTTLYDLVGLAVDPVQPGNLYASVYNGGVYKSTDEGATWSAFNNGLTDLNV